MGERGKNERERGIERIENKLREGGVKSTASLNFNVSGYLVRRNIKSNTKKETSFYSSL